jgi:tetratricopeptide (TPR) repeat protein
VTRAKQGDVARARAELEGVVDGPLPVASARYVLFARISLGDLARQAGRLDEAARYYTEAELDLGRVPAYAPLFHGMLSCALGALALARGETGPARQHLREALALAAQGADMPFVADVGVTTARLQWQLGLPAKAARLLGAAHALRGTADERNPEVTDLVNTLTAELGERDYPAAYAMGVGLSRTGALDEMAEALGPI